MAHVLALLKTMVGGGHPSFNSILKKFETGRCCAPLIGLKASCIEAGRGQTYSWTELEWTCLEKVTMIIEYTGGHDYFSRFFLDYFSSNSLRCFHFRLPWKRLPCVGTSSAYIDLEYDDWWYKMNRADIDFFKSLAGILVPALFD